MHKFNINKILVLVLSVLLISSLAYADVHVRSYTKSDGTVVKEHYRSDPDGDASNNWSHIGNVNPYTGKEGTKRDYDQKDYGGNYIPSTDLPSNSNDYTNPFRDFSETDTSSDDSYNIDINDDDNIAYTPLNDNIIENDSDDNNYENNDDNHSDKSPMSNALKEMSKQGYNPVQSKNDNKSSEKNIANESKVPYIVGALFIAFIFYKIGKHKHNK